MTTPIAIRVLLLSTVAFGAAGCGTIPVDSLKETTDLEIGLDASARAYAPGVRVKFFVDVFNRSGAPVDLSGLKIELVASPARNPKIVALREQWTYRWPSDMPPLRPEKRLTVPVVPESGTEFQIDQLVPGMYRVVAGRERALPLKTLRAENRRAGSERTLSTEFTTPQLRSFDAIRGAS